MAEKQQEMAEKLKEVAEKMKEVADNVKRFLSMNDEKYNELKESQETLRNSLIDIPERITAIEYRLNTVGVQTEIQ
jgi:DNA repair exonuclease SbcCD ATPase subunit